MRSFELKIGSALLAVSLAAITGYAQTGDADPTVATLQPAVRPLYSGSAISGDASSQAHGPDQLVLAGAQEISPEAQVERRSFWQPFFNLTSTIDSNPLGVGSSINVVPWASFYGGVDLHASSHWSDLSVNYLGGGVVSQYHSEDAPIQQLMLAERLSWRHAAISFFDQFGFFPQAVSALNLPTGVPDPSDNDKVLLQPAFLPNQFITNTVGQEITNSSVGELDVSLTPHSSLSALGSYSLVRFFDNNLLDLNDTVIQTGFNHQLTRSNSIALLYRFNAFRFNNLYQPMNGHVVEAAFGRRITRRWAFEVMAGPELAQFWSAPAPATLTTGNAVITQFQRVYLTTDASVTYRTGRSQLHLGYTRGVTDGAGYLQGAATDAGYGSIEHQLSRRVIGEITAGYAINRGLTAVAPQQNGGQIYQDWYGAATVSHAWGR